MTIFSIIGEAIQFVTTAEALDLLYAEALETNPELPRVGFIPQGYDVEMVAHKPDGYFKATSTGDWVEYTPEQRWSSKVFLERFTIEELRSIYTAAETNVDLRIWLDRAMGADYISNQDPSTLEGMAYLVYQGLLAQERHDEILFT